MARAPVAPAKPAMMVWALVLLQFVALVSREVRAARKKERRMRRSKGVVCVCVFVRTYSGSRCSSSIVVEREEVL